MEDGDAFAAGFADAFGSGAEYGDDSWEGGASGGGGGGGHTEAQAEAERMIAAAAEREAAARVARLGGPGMHEDTACRRELAALLPDAALAVEVELRHQVGVV